MKREEYTREEHLYLIRKQMGVSTGKFNMMEVRFNIHLKRKVVLAAPIWGGCYIKRARVRVMLRPKTGAVNTLYRSELLEVQYLNLSMD